MKFGQAVNYSVTINPTNNMGFLVGIGCQSRVYSNAQDMLADLTEYFTEFEKVNAQYRESIGNDVSCVPTAPPRDNYGVEASLPQVANSMRRS